MFGAARGASSSYLVSLRRQSRNSRNSNSDCGGSWASPQQSLPPSGGGFGRFLTPGDGGGGGEDVEVRRNDSIPTTHDVLCLRQPDDDSFSLRHQPQQQQWARERKPRQRFNLPAFVVTT